MSVNWLYLSAFSTAVSVVALQWWAFSSLDGMKTDGLIGADDGSSTTAWESEGRALELLLSSRVTKTMLVTFVVNVYVLVVMLLKTLFFVQLNATEMRKVLDRFFNYILYKGIFLPLVVTPTISHVLLWSTWLILLCSLKIFLSLARDRLEKLNASPSVTPWKYFRVYSALLLALSTDILWMKLCTNICSSYGSGLFMLLFFEPFSIAFETLQAIMVHGFQMFEIYQRHSIEYPADSISSDIQKTTAGSLSEMKGILMRHCGFILDMMTLVMALSHYIMTWWLHGMAFHLVDVVIFLNLRALVSAITKRIKTYIKLRRALSSLDGALPDATYDELCAYDDECAICRGPMARAKKLSCNHLFHLVCLRSWLDQGLSEVYSCPTCRRPLFVSNSQGDTRPVAGNGTDDQRLAEQLNLGLNQQRIPGHALLPLGVSPNQQHNTPETIWRGTAFDSSLLPPWANQGMDGASSSTSARTAGFGGVQMMMRQLATVSENFAHGSLDDTAWNLWPSQHTSLPSIPSSSILLNRNPAGLRIGNAAPAVNNNMSELLAMVDRVREVLPHIPDELIVQDLLRTNNINITVNNLLVQ